jgi:hypothetical protein
MKTLFISVSIIFFFILSLILLSILLYENNKFSISFPAQEKETHYGEDSGFFEREEKEEHYDLTYGWENFERNTFYISFAISKKQLAEAENEFGYDQDELKEYLKKSSDEMIYQMIKYLKEFALRQIAKSKYARYFNIVEIGPDKFNLALSAPPTLHEEVKLEFGSITRKVFKERNSYLKKITEDLKKKRKKYFEEKGIRFTEDRIEIDYDYCVNNNRPRLKRVFELMIKVNRNLSVHQFLGSMLSFTQQIRYGNLPFKENSKVILEFWVPPKVLVNNMADCDSKAVTFASIWTHFKHYPVVLIKIKEHLFIGVGIPSPTGKGITIHGLRYTLCEVAGPVKIPPGLITRYSRTHLENGLFQYELVRSAR